MINPYAGSDFDEFLQKEGILEEVTAAAHKRLLALQRVTRESHLRQQHKHPQHIHRQLRPHIVAQTGMQRLPAW